MLPVDLGGKVFPVSGGLPLAKRAPQRQAYRLVELKRFSEYLDRRSNLQPKYFPVAGDDAAKLIIAVDMHDGTDAAMRIDRRGPARGLGRAAQHRRRRRRCRRCSPSAGCRRARLDDAQSQAVHERYEADTQRRSRPACSARRATSIDGEIFWGQDRLDFVQRKLQRRAAERHSL